MEAASPGTDSRPVAAMISRAASAASRSGTSTNTGVTRSSLMAALWCSRARGRRPVVSIPLVFSTDPRFIAVIPPLPVFPTTLCANTHTPSMRLLES